MVAETGFDQVTLRKIATELLREYAALKRWDKFNAILTLYKRQFGDHGLLPLDLSDQVQDITL